MRVVSLLPSATEMLCAIGARDLLVGRSHECDHPGDIDHLPALTEQRIGPGTPAEVDAQVRSALDAGGSLYSLDQAALAALRPDVILTQDLCDVCSIDLPTVERVASGLDPSPRVVSLNPTTFEQVLDDHLIIGEAVGRVREAEATVAGLRNRFYTAADQITPYVDPIPVAFLEWTDPLFMGGHWTPQLIERAGGSHLLNATAPVDGAGAAAGPAGTSLRAAGKSIGVTPEALVASLPHRLVICPCGISLDEAFAQTRELASSASWWSRLPATRAPGGVAVVDGNQMFNRPGPRLVDAFEWLVGWLNDRPETIPSDFPWRVFE